MFDSIIQSVQDILTPTVVGHIIRILIILLAGFPLLNLLVRVVSKSVKKRYSLQAEMITKKIIFYVGVLIILMMVLNEFGFRLSAILGAAGIMGIAIGFAAQTSVSNVISGIFLISEQPFAVGDIVQIGNTTGIVLSIDLLSIKLRTFDNRFIRIPNESIVKNESVNISRFPIRRMDLDIGVAYKEDIRRVIGVLKDIATKNPYCLEEPEPMIFLNTFGDSALIIRYALWFEKSDVINLKRSIMMDIKERFDAEDIEIPFPHRTIYTGEVTKPFPLTISDKQANQDDKT
jgi:small-conductance mechanosensitive channel